jgi:hypothetical protein
MFQQIANRSYLGEGNERYVTSVHESAHAVSWLALGGTLDAEDSVTIVPRQLPSGEILGGHFNHAMRWNSRQEARLLAEKHIISDFAGHQAELRLVPNLSRSPSDDECAEEAFRRFIHEGDMQTYLRAREQQAAELVLRYWPQIVAFSEELLRVQTLNGLQCQRLFDKLLSACGVKLRALIYC